MVRPAIILLVVGMLQASLTAGVAQAHSSDFSDGFDSFDETRWSKGDRNLGRSYIDPNNVEVSNGNLTIKLPANELNGGWIKSNDLYGYGSYTARMRLPAAPSSITAFFLYEPPDYASEIDIKIYNDTSCRIMFSTYSGGKQTHTQTMMLPYDPTSGFHDYRFDYASNLVSFYADGKLMKQWKGSVPQKPMHLYVNAWSPTWLEGKRPLADKTLLVDKISYTAQSTKVGTKKISSARKR